MQNLSELLLAFLGPQYFPLVQDVYRLTLTMLAITAAALFAIAVLLRMLLGTENFEVVLGVFRESATIVVVGVIFATMAQAIAVVFPVPWLRKLVEYVHEGLLVLVLAAIVFKSLTQTCDRFEMCRVLSQKLAERFRSRL